MKLADVSPRLLALLREDAITLDQLAALALADDHETQEHILCRRRQAALSRARGYAEYGGSPAGCHE
jgi:hypothetical protein